MPAAIGPYDGRKARRKRCDSCAKQQIKCSGGIPCQHCIRTYRTCEFTPKKTGISFVVVQQGPSGKKTTSRNTRLHDDVTTLPLVTLVSTKGTEYYISYFFQSFMSMNTFTSQQILINDELTAMLQHSPALRDAIEAVAALHSQQRKPLAVCTSNKESNIEALKAYARSVSCVQKKITAGTFLVDKSALWVTFILGIFELMRDSTGTNWLSHFLHGTSTMLRLQNPETLSCQDPLNSQRRSFFLATRIFEISRSFIFSDPSFLSNPEWTAAVSRLWEGEGAALWHPKEALFDMLPRFSDLSVRAIHFCDAAPQMSPHSQRTFAKSLAGEGFLLQALLQQWWLDASAWKQALQTQADTESSIGFIYYHATSIYLSGTYDYHSFWTASEAPILCREDVNWHVSEIVRLGHELLTQGVAGILLFFPLRVAGARASDKGCRNTILHLLGMTMERGFKVAEAFIEDLSGLWMRIDRLCEVDLG